MDAQQDVKNATDSSQPDVVTQIQDHIALISSRFFNFIGALQRDAPPAPLQGPPNEDPRRQELEKQILVMRQEVTESLTTLETLIKQLPDVTATPEGRQWEEAAALEGAGAAEGQKLAKELEMANEKINTLYQAHKELADAALSK